MSRACVYTTFFVWAHCVDLTWGEYAYEIWYLLLVYILHFLCGFTVLI